MDKEECEREREKKQRSSRKAIAVQIVEASAKLFNTFPFKKEAPTQLYASSACLSFSLSRFLYLARTNMTVT